MNELLTIIVPVFNVEKYLIKSIESLLVQTYKNLQIILIDDGSTDSSGKICDALQKTDCRIEVIHQDNHGVSHARNQGIKIAKGRYIAFMDPDDTVEKTIYEEMYRNMKNNSAQCSVVGFKKIYEKDGCVENFNYDSELKIMTGMDALNCAMNKKDMWVGYPFNKLFDATILNTYNIRFNEKLIINEDSLFCYQYLLHCPVVVRAITPLYNYLIRDTSITRTILKNNKKIWGLLDAADEMLEFANINNKGGKMYQNIVKYSIEVHVQCIYYMFMNNIYDRKILKKIYQKLDYLYDMADNIPLNHRKQFFYLLARNFPYFTYNLVCIKRKFL